VLIPRSFKLETCLNILSARFNLGGIDVLRIALENLSIV
jgi:hypothetical protein